MRSTSSFSIGAALCVAIALSLACGGAWAKESSEQQAITKKLKVTQSRYYVIYSDLPDAKVAEAAARLTAVAEEYHRRTAGFSGTINRRMSFYLFSGERDYHAMGGPPGSCGVFNGRALMAIANDDGFLWHTVQHEAFHQFASFVITPRLPIWVNEGLAEYFGEGIWTGDNFFTGVIPADRLKRVQKLIRDKKILPFGDMNQMSGKSWIANININNYDQAWSMVHFLIYGDGGKYQKAFALAITDIARGVNPGDAFAKHLGGDPDDFQEHYEKWWLALDENSTADIYTQSAVAAITSALARAHASGQKFKDFEDFLSAAKAQRLKNDTRQDMPETLVRQDIAKAAYMGQWTLEYEKTKPHLVLVQADLTKFIGTFEGRSNEAFAVEVKIVKPQIPGTSSTEIKPRNRPA